MKVCFGIPSITGSMRMECHASLVALYRILNNAGIDYDELHIYDCPYLPAARNTLAAMFLEDPEATDLFFIDYDEKFDPMAVLKILERPEKIVAGAYPLKKDFENYPVEVKTEDGIPVGRDGLIEALFLPTGFMRIKRVVFELMAKAYPDDKYTDSVIEIRNSPKLCGAHDFFGMGVNAGKRRYTTEDFAFCQRWRDIGGQLWVYPDIDFEHIGMKAYKGNYHQFLMKCPGGKNSLETGIQKAIHIPGWMTIDELRWLGDEAKKASSIVEIGSWLGRSTMALAASTLGSVFAVDTWKGSEEHKEIVAALPSGDLFAAFKKNLDDTNNVSALRMTSLEAAASLSGKKFDMVFIDGAHDYESVKSDLLAWLPLVADGGIICGHDFADAWPDVMKAVSEFLPGITAETGTSIWSRTINRGLPSADDLDAVEHEREISEATCQ